MWRKLTLFFLLIFPFLGTRVFAAPPLPAPKCVIGGVVENVRFEEAFESPCVKTNSCPTDTRVSSPDMYYLTIHVTSVSFKEGDMSVRSCDDLYPAGSTRDVFIVKDTINLGDTLRAGQTITGTVVSFGGSSFETYEVKNSEEMPRVVEVPQNIFQKITTFVNEILRSLLKLIQ